MRARNYFLYGFSIFVFPVHSSLAEHPPSSAFSIERISYSGAGCPAGSASAAATDDGGAFIVIFSKMAAQAGPSVAADASKRSCEVHLQLSIPKGWSYALTSVDFHGFAALDSGVVASQAMTYHISGESPESTAAFSWQGPLQDEYAIADIGGAAPPYWSRCGGGKNLTIKTTLTVGAGSSRDASALLELDDVDGQIFHLSWQSCH